MMSSVKSRASIGAMAAVVLLLELAGTPHLEGQELTADAAASGGQEGISHGTLLLGVDQDQAQLILQQKGFENLVDMTAGLSDKDQPYLLILPPDANSPASTVLTDLNTFNTQSLFMAQQVIETPGETARDQIYRPGNWADIEKYGIVPGNYPTSTGTIIYAPYGEQGNSGHFRSTDHSLCEKRIKALEDKCLAFDKLAEGLEEALKESQEQALMTDAILKDYEDQIAVLQKTLDTYENRTGGEQ